MLELLNQVVRQHPVLDLINRSAGLISRRFERLQTSVHERYGCVEFALCDIDRLQLSQLL